MSALTSLDVDWDNPEMPGDALLRVIKSNEWTQAHFALRCSLSPKHVNQIIKGNAGYSPEVAMAFEMVTGIRCVKWLNLQSAWLTHRDRARIEAEFDARMAAIAAAAEQPIDLWPVAP